jgi:RimJ/RimL family protein N-acetyltransferase
MTGSLDVRLDELVLHSERLTLRPWRPGDAAAVRSIMADPRMNRYLRLPDPYTESAAREFVTDLAPGVARAGRGADLAVADIASGRVVGAIGLHLDTAKDWRAAEIGYWMDSACWGRGYAVEATRTVSRFAIEHGTRRLQIRCDVGNVASAAVAMRAGYSFEGVLRQAVESAAGPADCAMFSRLAADSGAPMRQAWPPLPDADDGVVGLRPMEPHDWPVVLAEQNNAESRRWSLFDAAEDEHSAREVALRSGLDRLVSTHARLVVVDAGNGSGAGTMLLRRSGPPDVVGIGYGLLPGFRGRRFTTRALNLLAEWAFGSTSIARLELGCKVDNVASARAAEGAGFVAEGLSSGRLRNPDGGYSDELRYARTR